MTTPRSRQWLLIVAVCVMLLALLVPSLTEGAVPHQDAVPAYAEEQTILQAEKDVPEPGWGSAASGRVHIDRHFLGQYGDSEANVILQRGGNTWRTLRNGPIATIAGTLILVVPLLIFGFYTMAGPARLDRPESGRQIQRFTAWDRTVHWATAISFLILAATGLIIMFGKNVMLPWMGNELFSWVAVIAKYLHNFVGPLFIVCSVVMFLTYLRRNFFSRQDWQWVRMGGGMGSHRHIRAGFFNAGEKVWFWGGLVLLGLVMSVTGLILDFVTFGQTRYVLQWANYLHVGGATLYIVGAMGHIYMGTLGTPGAYRGMRHGTVDEEWARAHHESWLNEIQSGAHPDGSRPSPVPPGATHQPRH